MQKETVIDGFFRKCFFNSTSNWTKIVFTRRKHYIHKVYWENLHLRTERARHSVRSENFLQSIVSVSAFFFFPLRRERREKFYTVFYRTRAFYTLFNWWTVYTIVPRWSNDVSQCPTFFFAMFNWQSTVKVIIGWKKIKARSAMTNFYRQFNEYLRIWYKRSRTFSFSTIYMLSTISYVVTTTDSQTVELALSDPPEALKPSLLWYSRRFRLFVISENF